MHLLDVFHYIAQLDYLLLIKACKTTVVLYQLVRFLVVELTHLNSNHKFNMSVVFTANYSFSEK
jgi:hypothetical protein